MWCDFDISAIICPPNTYIITQRRRQNTESQVNWFDPLLNDMTFRMLIERAKRVPLYNLRGSF